MLFFPTYGIVHTADPVVAARFYSKTLVKCSACMALLDVVDTGMHTIWHQSLEAQVDTLRLLRTGLTDA